jgi:hypothetical protein
MPKKKLPNTYTVERQRKKSFADACQFAVGLSLDRGGHEDVTIVENNPNTGASYYITVTAAAEPA